MNSQALETPEAREISGDAKAIFAHFMVGNTYPYKLDDWISDIHLASKSGIDGFALNVGREDWQLDRVADCFEACRLEHGVPSNFRLFISFDMSSIPSATAADIHYMKEYVARFAHQPCYHKSKGRAVISTFAGESCLVGYDDLHRAWSHVKTSLSKIYSVFIIPSFFVDPRRLRELSTMDGYFNWNGCWPVHLSPTSPREDIHLPALSTDRQYITYLDKRHYMASVSPWFFTHYGVDSWNKNWLYRGDDWLFVRRWEQLVQMRHLVDSVQIISWNDYGESHYIGPIKGAQPNSEAWVNGFDHTPFLQLNAYFAHGFKHGTYPPISEDRIFAWARPHSKHAVATEDNVPRPNNWQLTDDVFWVVIMAAAPALVSLGSVREDLRHIIIQAGLTKLHCPLVEGGSMHVLIIRGSETVLELSPQEFRYSAEPKTYNFNVYVAACP